MEYVNLTGTGLKVSRFCLGTMEYGAQANEKDSIEMVHYAIDQGINFVDTANVYQSGESERITGKAIKKKRDKLVLATKVGSFFGKGPNENGLSRRHILEQVDASLKRLDTDFIDIYYMHRPDPNTPVAETLEAMDTIIRNGKVRYIGISNFAAWQACMFHYEGIRRNLNFPVVSEMVYNPLTRGIEQEYLSFIEQFNIGLVVYNPLAGGLLTGKYKDKKLESGGRFRLKKGYYNRYWNEENFGAVEEFSFLANKAGISLVELSMRWLHSQSCVDSILVGASKMSQLSENLAALRDGPLPAELLEGCDSIWEKIKGSRYQYNR